MSVSSKSKFVGPSRLLGAPGPAPQRRPGRRRRGRAPPPLPRSGARRAGGRAGPRQTGRTATRRGPRPAGPAPPPPTAAAARPVPPRSRSRLRMVRGPCRPHSPSLPEVPDAHPRQRPGAAPREARVRCCVWTWLTRIRLVQDHLHLVVEPLQRPDGALELVRDVELVRVEHREGGVRPLDEPPPRGVPYRCSSVLRFSPARPPARRVDDVHVLQQVAVQLRAAEQRWGWGRRALRRHRPSPLVVAVALLRCPCTGSGPPRACPRPARRRRPRRGAPGRAGPARPNLARRVYTASLRWPLVGACMMAA